MRQKTTITYLEHNMLACNRINRAIASWKKHVRVFSETCTSFSENTYMFLEKLVRVFWGYNGDRWCKATPVVPLGIVSNMTTPILTQGAHEESILVSSPHAPKILRQ